jgi:4-amino-4-deoxy-L-arabinose transferase-like glycosyltransferase
VTKPAVSESAGPARDQFPCRSSRQGRLLLLAIVLATLVRAVVVIVLSANFREDPDAYRMLAETLYHHGVFGVRQDRPTAFRPPLYPLLLAPWTGGAGLTRAEIGSLHVLLGLATLLATIAVARRWGLSWRQQIAALALVALDPILLYQSTFVMTETLATLLAVLVLWTLPHAVPPEGTPPQFVRRGLAAGVALGLAMLCRPTFLLWLPGILVGFARADGKLRQRSLAAAGCLVGLVLVLAPWTVRNWYLFGKPIFATTHGGYTLWLANNEYLYEYWRTGPHDSVWEATPIDNEQAQIAREVGGDEVAADRVAYARAWESMRRDPEMFFRGCLDRWRQLWQPLPHRLTVPEPAAHRTARWLIAAWYGGLYLLALLGAYRIGWRWTRPPWIWGLTLLLAITVAHTFYWSNMRMRAPLIPVVALVAASGMRGGRNKPCDTGRGFL